MNKDFYNNIEDSLQHNAVDCASTSEKLVWKSIYNNFHPVRRLPSCSMCLILIASLLFLSYADTNKPTANTQATNKTNVSSIVNHSTPEKLSIVLKEKIQLKNPSISDHSIEAKPTNKKLISTIRAKHIINIKSDNTLPYSAYLPKFTSTNNPLPIIKASINNNLFADNCFAQNKLIETCVNNIINAKCYPTTYSTYNENAVAACNLLTP